MLPRFSIKWDWEGHCITTRKAGRVHLWLWVGKIRFLDKKAWGFIAGPLYFVWRWA